MHVLGFDTLLIVTDTRNPGRRIVLIMQSKHTDASESLFALRTDNEYDAAMSIRRSCDVIS